jgi:hypothetical protein
MAATLPGTAALMRHLFRIGSAFYEAEMFLDRHPELRGEFEAFLAEGNNDSDALRAWLERAARRPRVVWTNPDPPAPERRP